MIRPLLRRVRRPERGQGLVEFAFVVPLIVLLVSGGIDMGRLVFAQTTLANAARHGARVAAVNQINPGNGNISCQEDMPIENVADPHWSARACTAWSSGTIGVTVSAVTLSYAAPTDVALSCSPTLHIGCIARISVTTTWRAITPVVGSILDNVTLTATSEHPLERVFP